MLANNFVMWLIAFILAVQAIFLALIYLAINYHRNERALLHAINSAAIVPEDHKILRMDNTLIGRRRSDHPDIPLAINTPGLKVVYPDGRVEVGVQ